jgi:hypothetical protein
MEDVKSRISLKKIVMLEAVKDVGDEAGAKMVSNRKRAVKSDEVRDHLVNQPRTWEA